MKRIVMLLAAAAVFCIAANQAQAHGWHHGPRPHYGQTYYYARTLPPPARVRVMVPPPAPPCQHYYPAPSGFFFQGRNVSIGVGF